MNLYPPKARKYCLLLLIITRHLLHPTPGVSSLRILSVLEIWACTKRHLSPLCLFLPGPGACLVISTKTPRPFPHPPATPGFLLPPRPRFRWSVFPVPEDPYVDFPAIRRLLFLVFLTFSLFYPLFSPPPHLPPISLRSLQTSWTLVRCCRAPSRQVCSLCFDCLPT